MANAFNYPAQGNANPGSPATMGAKGRPQPNDAKPVRTTLTGKK